MKHTEETVVKAIVVSDAKTLEPMAVFFDSNVVEDGKRKKSAAVAQAAKYTGVHPATVRKVLQGKMKKAAGFIFEATENYYAGYECDPVFAVATITSAGAYDRLDHVLDAGLDD